MDSRHNRRHGATSHRNGSHRHSSHRHVSHRSGNETSSRDDHSSYEAEDRYGAGYHSRSRRHGSSSGRHSPTGQDNVVFFNVDGLTLYHQYESENGYVPAPGPFSRRDSLGGASRRSVNATDMRGSRSDVLSPHGSLRSRSYDSTHSVGQGPLQISDSSESDEYANLGNEHFGGRRSVSLSRSPRGSIRARSIETYRSQDQGRRSTSRSPTSRGSRDDAYYSAVADQDDADSPPVSRHNSLTSVDNDMIQVFYVTTDNRGRHRAVSYEDVPRGQITELSDGRLLGGSRIMSYDDMESRGHRSRASRSAPHDRTGERRMGFLRNLFRQR